MKITDRFIGDHKTFRKLIKDIDLIDNLGDEKERRKLIRAVELFVDHLLLHAWGEETFYYPVVGKAAAASSTVADSAYMKLLDDEHHIIDTALQDVERMVKAPAIPAEWRSKYDQFKKHLLAHMAKEEEEFFPLSEKLLGQEGLENISQTLEKNRSKAPAIRIHQKL
jgi:iron-sulfur cluster repair protein YtfE (RIC family)